MFKRIMIASLALSILSEGKCSHIETGSVLDVMENQMGRRVDLQTYLNLSSTSRTLRASLFTPQGLGDAVYINVDESAPGAIAILPALAALPVYVSEDISEENLQYLVDLGVNKLYYNWKRGLPDYYYLSVFNANGMLLLSK